MGYTVGRVPINSCDFGPGEWWRYYNFDDVAGDVSLAHFDDSVSHDVESGMIPMIKAAQTAIESAGGKLALFASPWSPPGWMKLPVKGVRDDSYANWQSQVTSMYGGPLDFIFVVEAEDDPAYPHIERLIREHADANIRLLVAGRTWYCSQKMHNQLHGFEAVLRTAAKYVILLDDDIHLHPGTIRIWVEEMESDPKAVVASGYTFDWVGPSVTGMAPYLWMMWRIVASVAFHHVRV